MISDLISLYLNPAFPLRPPLLSVSSIWNPRAQIEIKITAKMREEVNFLIGFQSSVIPRGLSRRKLMVVGWAESRLQNADLF